MLDRLAIAAIVTEAAKADLAVARRDSKRPDRHGVGDMIVCRTRKGNIQVKYEAATRTYTLTQCGLEPVQLAKGALRVVTPVLADLYLVAS